MTEALAFAAVVAALFAAGLAVRRAARAEAARRLGVLSGCAELLDGARLSPDAAGYGVLRGRFEGVDVALRPFADTLAFRRLPQLWLAVTVGSATGAETLDILRRPTGADGFPPAAAARRVFPAPAAWPEDTLVRGSGRAAPLIACLTPTLRGVLAEDATKQVLVTPRGVRVVRRIAQGGRGAYLLFRDSRFEETQVTKAEAEAALREAIGVAQAAANASDTRDEHALAA